MITISQTKVNSNLIIPNLRDSKFLEQTSGVMQYQVILLDTSTKGLHIFNSINTSASPLYYKLQADLSELPTGEYTYMVVSYDAWKVSDIDVNDIAASTRRINLESYKIGGLRLKYGNKILFTGKDVDTSFTSEDLDEPPSVVCLDVLATGILKITACEEQAVDYKLKPAATCELQPIYK
jgi:hypothetical protein